MQVGGKKLTRLFSDTEQETLGPTVTEAETVAMLRKVGCEIAAPKYRVIPMFGLRI